jgi:ribosomal protein S18 acetylase RimI-like enzyme
MMHLDDPSTPGTRIRHLAVRDFARIAEIGRTLYPHEKPWTDALFQSQLDHFARGQMVAVEADSDRVLGYAASLIIAWEDYGHGHTWSQVTGGGTFKTHDPTGRTLYGADVMVAPEAQGRGIGKAFYAARRQTTIDLNLRRIRAMARIRGYHQCADTLSPREYVDKVVAGQLADATLSFQLKQGFNVLDVVPGYLRHDPESLGFAAVIEWINDQYTPAADNHPRA